MSASEPKPKRVLSEKQKAVLAAGREKAQANKANKVKKLEVVKCEGPKQNPKVIKSISQPEPFKKELTRSKQIKKKDTVVIPEEMIRKMKQQPKK